MKSREWLTSVLAGVILGVAGLITGVWPHFFAPRYLHVRKVQLMPFYPQS